MKNIISEEYQNELINLHASNPQWGTSGSAYVDITIRLAKKHDCKSILDFGCGKNRLLESVALKLGSRSKIILTGYDPCVDLYAHNYYCSGDLVVCTDVLEHIEYDKLDEVLKTISSRTNKLAFFTISLVPARQKLSDGRNAHLIIEISDWWSDKLIEKFSQVDKLSDNGKQVDFICFK